MRANDILAARVTPAMLMRLNEAMVAEMALPAAERGDLVVVSVIAFADHHLSVAVRLAIQYRMMALANLVRSGKLRGFYVEDGPGQGRLRGEVFVAAAQAGIRINRRGPAKPRFDTREFQRLVMGLTQEAGTA